MKKLCRGHAVAVATGKVLVALTVVAMTAGCFGEGRESEQRAEDPTEAAEALTVSQQWSLSDRKEWAGRAARSFQYYNRARGAEEGNFEGLGWNDIYPSAGRTETTTIEGDRFEHQKYAAEIVSHAPLVFEVEMDDVPRRLRVTVRTNGEESASVTTPPEEIGIEMEVIEGV